MNFSRYITEALEEVHYAYSCIPKKVYEVYRIACRYFGKERVELTVGYDAFNPEMLQGDTPTLRMDEIPKINQIENPEIVSQTIFWSVYGLLIYFPSITVVNELEKSTVIKDVFIRIPLQNDGKLAAGFKMMRTTYTNKELKIGYMHSHCKPVSKSRIYEWKSPCLGTGPIRRTISTLISSFDDRCWGLFFWELDKFTQVESLSGVPYIRLQNLGASSGRKTAVSVIRTNVLLQDSERETLTHLIKSYLSTNLFKLNVLNGKIILGMPFLEWLVQFTEYYDKWRTVAVQNGYTENLDRRVVRYAIKDNVLHMDEDSNNWNSLIGFPLVKFKGTAFNFDITTQTSESTGVWLFEAGFAYFILNQLLTYINVFYAKQYLFGPLRPSGTENFCGPVIGVSL